VPVPISSSLGSLPPRVFPQQLGPTPLQASTAASGQQSRRPDDFVGAPHPATASPLSSEAHFDRLHALCAKVPGEDPSVLAAYLKDFVADPAAVTRVLGPDWDPARVAAMLSITHQQGELLPANIAFLGPRKPASDGSHSFSYLALIADRKNGHPLGYALQTIRQHADGKRSAFLDYLVADIKRPEAKGIGAAALHSQSALMNALGVSESQLKTAWLGRWYWAVQGYDFANASERNRVLNHFRAFLDHFGVQPSELVIDAGGTEAPKPFAWEELRHSWDVAQVKSTRRQLTVPAFLGVDETREQPLDVGRAFYLGDFRDPRFHRETLRTGSGRPEDGSLFLRNWDGVRQMDERSPSQAQRRRYLLDHAARRSTA
jgi:hypothetical protein